MKKIRTMLLLMSIGLIGACSTRNSAPIVDRAPGQVSRTVGATPSIPAKGSDDRAYYTVKKNDTLYHIALEVGQNYRDIIAWNNLANPNDIKVDQVLRVSPPDAGSVPGGIQTGSVTTGSVSTGSAVEVRPLSAPTTATAAAVVPAVPATNKTGPRGDKRAYSDATLAELQKPDPVAPTVATAATVAPKPAEKTAETRAAMTPEDENVSWMWPADGKLIAGFDESKKGIDIAGQVGQPIVAAASGKVMYAGSGIRGYGNLVIVKHTGSLLSAYAHNKTILVKEGQMVSKGQKIAEMGSSDADAVRLHFEIRRQGKPVDPSRFLPNR